MVTNCSKTESHSWIASGGCYLLLFVALGLLLSPPFLLFAQGTTTGDVVGTVTDTTGAVIPGATVQLTSVETGETQTTVTTGSGDYLFTFLKPGTYGVTVTANGFRNLKIAPFKLSAGDRARQDAHMAIGTANQTVEVTSEQTGLVTDSSALSTLVSNEAVQNLPLSGRNFISLVYQTAGVTSGLPGAVSSGTKPDDRRQAAAVSANGQTDMLNNEMIDGMDNNERIIGLIGVRPSIEAIQEVQVQTNSYPAEVGRTPGAAVNIITKYGTNDFHGSAYEYLENTSLDAYPFDFGATLPKPPLHQNQFGGSLGGPILRNRTFFFGDYEDLKISKDNPPTATSVPTAFEESNIGNFTDNPALNVTVNPANFDFAGLQYFKLFPTPNQPGFANNYVSSSNYTMDAKTVDARVDHRFNDSNLFYARYTLNLVNTFIGGLLPPVSEDGVTIHPGGNPGLYFGPATDNATNAALSYIHIFTPHLVAHLQAGYTYFYNATLPENSGVNVNAAFGQPNVNYDSLTSGLGVVSVTGMAGLGDGAPLPLDYIENWFQYMGSVTYTRGKHSIKIGAAIVRRQSTATKSSPGRGSWSIASLPLLLQGTFTSFSRNVTLVRQHYRTWEPSEYVEDDWHILHNLTLNLGVRYDIFTPYTAVKNQISNFDPINVQILVAGVNSGATAGVATNYSDIGPRVGFAYSVTPTLVLRGGFGMSYVPENIGGTASMRNPPFLFSYGPCSTSGAAACSGYNKMALGEPLPAGSSSSYMNPSGSIANATALNFRPTEVEQFNLTLQKELAGNVISATYLGMLGRHIAPTSAYDINSPPLQVAFTNTTRPYYGKLPNVTSVLDMTSNGTGNYNALQAQVEHRMQHGLTYRANYSWAHGLNDMPDYGGAEGWGIIPSKIGTLDYGNSDVEVADQVNVAIDYALPFGSTLKGVQGAIARGWQVNLLYAWQTGFPVTVVNSANRTGTTTSSGSDRPNQSGSASVSNRTISHWFNTSAFSPQPLGTLGSERRNQIYGPHARHLDVSLFKDFRLHEDATLQFRAELFNVTNTANFSTVSGQLGTQSFGTVSGLVPNYLPRTAQIVARVEF